jgi:hypothetical protein
VTKPVPKKGATSIRITESERLDDSAFEEMSELLGKPHDSMLRRRIEFSAGLAIDAEPLLDHIPRGADHKATFSRTEKLARALLLEMRGLTEFEREIVEGQGVDLAALEAQVGRFAGASAAIVQMAREMKERGAPPKVALLLATLMLAKLFDDEYRGPARGRVARRIEFVTAALEGVRAVPCGYTGVGRLLNRKPGRK